MSLRRTALILLVAAAGAASAAPTAHTAARCSVGSGRGLGFSYVTSLSASRTSCRTARTVVKAYSRHRAGSLGYRCARRIVDRSPVQYDARATCTKGRAAVRFTYTQNTA